MTAISRDGVSYGYSYNGDGSVSQMTNPRSFSTSYSSYYRGIPQSESRPAGVGVSRTVSSAGNITSESVAGQGFGYSYDGINRVTGITYPTGSGVSISYGSASKTATRGGLSESTTYNGYGYMTGVTLGGIGRTYGVDALGRRTSETNPGGGGTTDYGYDILGRVTNINNQDGSSRSIGYNGNTATVSDERGYSTTYDYRSYGDPEFQALVSISSPLQATTIGRNNRDLTQAVTQGGKTRTYGYNSNYYVTSIIDPETGTTTYGRDAMGNMTSRQVGSAGTTTYTYDGLDRMTGASYPGGIGITKTYNGRGRLLTVTGGAGDRSYGYDSNDNLTTETLNVDSQTLTATYAYNTLDQLASITYTKTGRTVSYAPDALGRPAQVGTYVTGVNYHNSGQVNTITYANGATTSYGQNSRLWPSSFNSSKSAAFINSTYSYDGTGNLTTINDSVDNSLNRTLGYDGIGRLTSAAGPWGAGSFVYDGVGNITSRSYGGAATTYVYDNSSNRLTSMAGQRNATFSYGDYASITNDGNNAYNYDGVPNLTCVNCIDVAKKVAYAYDGTNTRVSRVKGGVTTYEFFDAKGNLLLEYTPTDNDKTVEHIYLGNKRVAQRSKDTAVPKLATTISLTANPTSVTCSGNTTLTATVSPAAATGTVNFLDSGQSVGSASLVNGVATLTLALPRPGSRTISAQYQGNATYDGSLSSGVTVNVTTVANTITLAYSPSPPYAPGNPLTITATIGGCVQGDGSVTFQTVSSGSISSIPTATKPLVGRVATYTFSPGLGRNYQFRATLTGDSIATNNIFADGQFDVLFNPVLTMTATPSTVATNAVTQLSAMLTSSNPGSAPVGNVVFMQGSTTLGSVYVPGTVPVQPATYNFTVPWTPGIYPIIATFSGDSIHYAGTSAPVNLTVLAASSTSVSASPDAFTYSANTTLTATVSSTSGTPTGTISFYDGATLLGTSTLSAGVATLNTSAIVAGVRQITAVYAGNASFGGSASTAVSVTVSKVTPVVTITSITPSPSTAFASTTILATVTGTPTPPPEFGSLLLNGGVIDVMNGGAGSLTLATNRIPAGTYQVVVRYPMTANFNQADSAPVSLTVTGSACNLDVNRTTVFDEPDGRAILAWLLGFRGTALYNASQNSNGVDAIGIDTFITPQVNDLTFDLDGDGKVLATTDGLMLLRISLGLTGAAVTSNAINPAGTRPDWTSVKNYVNTTCGLSLP